MSLVDAINEEKEDYGNEEVVSKYVDLLIGKMSDFGKPKECRVDNVKNKIHALSPNI
jgi:hypothetical protein